MQNGQGTQRFHHSGLEPGPLCPDLIWLALSSDKHWVTGLYWSTGQDKNISYESSYITDLNWFLACFIFIFALLKANIKIRQDIPRVLWLQNIDSQDLLNWHKIGVDHDRFFLITFFCSILIELVIGLKKWEVGTWNLGQIFKTNLIFSLSNSTLQSYIPMPLCLC